MDENNNKDTIPPTANNEINDVSTDNDYNDLPDVTKLSKSDRKELLRRLMEFEQKESTTASSINNDINQIELNISQDDDPLNNFNPLLDIPREPVINISDSNSNQELANYLPRYSSTSVCYH